AFGANVRFRLAESLADRADLEPSSSTERKTWEEEALKALEPTIKEASLQGFVQLLRGDLLGRAGLYVEALNALDLAAKANPAPPKAELLEGRGGVLLRQERFDAALRAMEQAGVSKVWRGVFPEKPRLEQRADLTPGPQQSEVESELFRLLNELRASALP